MNVDSSAPDGSPASRRKSGRATRKPTTFSQEVPASSSLTNGTGKRKRADELDAEDDEAEAEDAEGEFDDAEDEDGDGTDEEPDEEELKAQRRTKKTKLATTKPAAKRAKTTNGASTTLAIRSANEPRKTSKSTKTQKARARPSQMHEQGLYAEVFGRGQSPEDAASGWYESVQKDSVTALKDLVNFVLRCITCDSKVEAHDIEDLDSVPNKLGDVLQEYEQQKNPDYPLISKAKQYAGFQEVLEEFFAAIVKTLHSSSAFYDQPEIYDNIHVWIATMSGANYKSFRHTATIISLAMSTALCEVAKEIQELTVTLKKQVDTERQKKNSNKSRMKTVEESLKAAEKKLEVIDNQLQDAFNTVYVHRYRDVEERIRAPCVAALGNWIVLYRKMFLEGQYLRYLGWVLNDTSAPTRLEDIKQLRRLFNNKNNIAALRAFTDRFRSRLVEMGARDADISVRAETIELLDKLRNAELLEPDDIDTIGRLIFDTEPRIRRAVAKFFVANIEDLYKAIVEDFDQAQFKTILPAADKVDDTTTPTRSWIKYKCLGSVLVGYNNDEESLDGVGPSLPMNSTTESRFTLATQSILPHMQELQKWEDLAGYLLHDHSSIPTQGNEDDLEFQIQQAYKLSPGEDTILLDILHAAVKTYLQSLLEPTTNKRTNAAKDQIREKQEFVAQDLSVILPQLLSKFGSTPQAASAILRLEQLLDLSLITDVQSEEVTYSTIVDDISKQFISHSDKQVLAAASAALRNARSYEQSKEAADAKVQEIWTESVSTLASLLDGKPASSRGTLDKQTLSEVVNTVVRLAELAGVYDCSTVIESKLPAPSRRQKGKSGATTTSNLLNLLYQLLERGEPDNDTSLTIPQLEDQLTTAVIELFSRYFRWKIVGLKKAITSNDAKSLTSERLRSLIVSRSAFLTSINPLITTRAPLDSIRVQAILSVLELHALFATVRHMSPSKGSLDEDTSTTLLSLIKVIPEHLTPEILTTFAKMEHSFARKTHRKIESSTSTKAGKKGKKSREEEKEPTQEEIEAPPEDSDDEDNNVDSDLDENVSSDDEGDLVGKGKNARRQAALLSEQGLCELTSKIIFAVVGGSFGEENGKAREVRERLMLNRSKLGKNYSVLVGYLDDKKASKPKKGAEKSKIGGKKHAEKEKAKVTSEEIILEDDDIVDDEEEVDEEEAQRRRELEEDDIQEEPEEEEDAGDVGGVVENDGDEIMGD
jgi:cohesin complex subunit SA-1/2